jgi:membrane associated rhomboid family serine protease
MASAEQTGTMVCYRHPKTETAVRCSTCERPICTDCMVFGAVGIKCPECAGQPTGPKRAASRVSTAGQGTEGLLTKALVAINVVVFIGVASQSGGGFGSPSGELFREGALFGPAVAGGDWWRLVTSGFLHASLIHLGFNMLMLWWFGRSLEAVLGRGRFLGVYGVSLLAGAAGSLLLNPEAVTVGASGAVFGILGAGLVLERRRIYVFGGSALLIIVFNIAFSAFANNVSLGGHLGGLAGGMLAMLALTRFGRGHAVYGRLGLVGIGGLVAVGVVSVAIAYMRVRGLA